MKILVISEPGVDGAFRYVEDLIDRMIGEGHVVHFAYSDIRGSDRLLHLVERVRTAGGQTFNLKVDNRPGVSDLRALQGLLHLCRSTRPDVIHAHSAKAGALIRSLRCVGLRTPIFYSPHAYYGMGPRPWLLGTFFNLLERLFAYTSITLNCSQDESDFAQTMLRIPAHRRRLILNGVNTDHFTPADAATRREQRVRLGIPPDAIVLGSLGRFSFQKDPATLHRAFLACAKVVPELHLVHVGRGDLRDEILEFAREHGYDRRVTWIEYLRDPVGFYQSLDGFILSSRYEGLSLAVLEALAVDLPLILSDAPGNRDFAQLNLSHFWSAQPESPEAFAAAIMSWYDDTRHRRPSNHREIALASFSSHAQFRAIEAEYARAAPAAEAPVHVPAPPKILLNKE